ncbi:MAG: hypothetical protein QOH84_589, partial [Kribbellaceae bacterium]|nr:hypothetical protein [Kribbellaceae bacterium]
HDLSMEQSAGDDTAVQEFRARVAESTQ